jgi:uncharacterized membrane protein YhiD involved in acid resistance
VDFNVQDLTGTFSVGDIAIALTLSFVLSAMIGWVYKLTHRNISYSQSYVQTLVILGMIIALIMLVVGSNIARAFALVGALSVVRFRNAIKETRDVGFIFLVMGIGMACGTRFYLLAIAAAVAICLVIVVMQRFNWFHLNVTRHVVKVQVPVEDGADYPQGIADVLIRYAAEFDLVSMESIHGGALTELLYAVRLKKGTTPATLIAALQERNAGQRVAVLTGYDQTDL